MGFRLCKVGNPGSQTTIIWIIMLLFIFLPLFVSCFQLLSESALIHSLLLIVRLRSVIGTMNSIGIVSWWQFWRFVLRPFSTHTSGATGARTCYAVRIFIGNWNARSVSDVHGRAVIFYWRNFRFEHVHCNHIDKHHPTGLVQDFRFILHKGNRRYALDFKLSSVWIASLQFLCNILLEFFHIKKFHRFVQFQAPSG